MKLKSLLLTLASAVALGAAAGPAQIQGVPYEDFAKKHNLPVKPLFDIPDTGTELPYDGEFTFDMIENWTGTGENRAALVIQWNDADGRDAAALVFGYRWDGVATGFDMFRDVTLNNPQLFGLVQRTNVGCDISAIAPDGYTLDGIGWDDDESGNPGLWDSANNDYYYPEGGLQYHPRGGSGIDGSYPDYDYDNWKAADSNDIWQAGWYIGYWSYWVKDSETSQFGYSGWGMSCRELVDGCWDGWNYCPDMMPVEWKEFMPAPANIPDDAVTEFTIDGLCYRLKNYKDKTVTLSAPFDDSAYTEASLVKLADGRHSIHSSFDYQGVTYTVVGIDKEAMVGAEINDIVIPESITSIGASAFAGSTVASVTLPDKLALIGESTFAGCINLDTVNIPSAMTEIPANAFAYTALKGTLVIPSSVVNIAASAFEGCESLTGIEIPKSVRMLMSKAFAGCTSLANVKVYATEPLTVDADLFDSSVFGTATLQCPKGFADVYAEAPVWKNFTVIKDDFLLDVNSGDRFVFQKMPYEITSLKDGEMTVKAKFHHFDGKHRDTAVEIANAKFSGDVVIPSEITYMDKKFRVTEISDSAFFRAKNLTSVTMPADIKGFGKNMFDGCEKLVSCNIPDNVTEISPNCFSSCAALKSIVIPAGVTAIGNNAFYYCSSLESISLPEGLKTIGERAFYECGKLTEIKLPAGVTAIPAFAFGNCRSLLHFEFSDRIASIGASALAGCIKLESVKLPSAITAIPNSLFDGCKALTSVNIPASVTSIGSRAFYNCAVFDFAIPAQITKIGSSAFYGCNALTEVSVPEGVTVLETSTFQNCQNLASVTLHDGITKIGGSVFRNCAKLSAITLGNKSRTASVELPSKLTTIESYLFQGCTSLTHIELPANVKSIGTYAFEKSGLESIVLNDGVTNLGGNCFNGTKLTEIELPATVTAVQANAFANCREGLKVYICAPDALKSIYALSFRLNSKQPYIYADLVVPAGKAAALSEKNYWKTSNITEPAVDCINYIDDNPVVSDNATVALSTSMTPVYETELPERFAAANTGILLPSLAVKVVYAPEGSEDEPMTADAEVTSGKATVTLTGVKPSTRYNYHFEAVPAGSDAVYASTPSFFETGETGVGSIVADGEGTVTAVYDLNGRQLDVNATLPAGIYIKVVTTSESVTTQKVIVK